MELQSHLYPFRSGLAQKALLAALNEAGPYPWVIRDSIYSGVYLRTFFHNGAKVRLYGDGPFYLIDVGDYPSPEIQYELENFIKSKLKSAAGAVHDTRATDILPFHAAPLTLYDNNPPVERKYEDAWIRVCDSWKSAEPSLSVVAFQVGTPATYYSENPRQAEGHHFDICGEGTTDMEVELHSPQLVERLLNTEPAGSADNRIMRSGEWAFFRNYGPGGLYLLNTFLAELAANWSQQTGRDVEFRLRMEVDPVPAVKTPGKGGSIELFRIEK